MTDTPECRYSYNLEYRAIPGRHEDHCDDTTCPGCLACHDNHCALCIRNHTVSVCASCVGTIRDRLDNIEDMSLRLFDEAVNHGTKSSAPGHNVLGGDPMVMLAMRYADQNGDRAPDREHERRNDPVPIIVTLGGWEDIYRSELGHVTDKEPSVGRALRYFRDHLHTLAAHDGDQFAEFAGELRALQASLEDALADGIRPQRGAPCVQCGRLMQRVEHRRRGDQDRSDGRARVGTQREGAQDHYHCRPCGRTVTDEQYRYAVGVTYRAHADRLTASDMHLQYGVKQGTLTGWATKGEVRKRGKSSDGRQLYDVGDVRIKLGLDAVEDEQDEPAAQHS